jgi:hypothetical protein
MGIGRQPEKEWASRKVIAGYFQRLFVGKGEAHKNSRRGWINEAMKRQGSADQTGNRQSGEGRNPRKISVSSTQGSKGKMGGRNET